jgi:WD40 repeat protein
MLDKDNLLLSIFNHYKLPKRYTLTKANNLTIVSVAVRLDTTLKEKFCLVGHTRRNVRSLISLPDKKLASCSTFDDTIRIWDGNNNYKCEKIISIPKRQVEVIVAFPNGNIAAGSKDSTITI